MNIKDFEFGGVALRLQTGDTVFEPNLTTRLIAENVPIPAGSRVLDLGCGIGPIAIISALKGAGQVIGVDIMAEACEYARENVELNGMTHKVQIIHSNLFEALKDETFDLIIDDVSGMAEGVSRISPWYPQTIPTGGPDGTGPTIQMLAEAREHLRPGGLMYFPVLSLAAAPKILEAARKLYGESLEPVAQKWVPFCDEFKENMPLMQQMKADGLIDYTTKRSRHLWSLEIYRVQA